MTSFTQGLILILGTMSTEIGCDEKENIISNEKPKYTYRELITLALADRTELTLSNIYSWIW